MASPYPTPSLVKQEYFDMTMCMNLSNHEGVDYKVRKDLQKYRKQATNGNKFRTVYGFGKNWEALQVGRLVPTPYLGLTTFPREVRAALAERYYWDVDIVNAQPVLLAHLAAQYSVPVPALSEYVMNRGAILKELMSQNMSRDDAKKLCLMTLFGGKPYEHPILPRMHKELSRLAKEVAEDPRYASIVAHTKSLKASERENSNIDFSTLAIVVQDFERRILLCIDNYFTSKERSLEVLIYDGGLLRKLSGEAFCPHELLRGAEGAVLESYGVQIELDVKTLHHTFQFDTDTTNLLPNDIVINDLYAARKFVELLGDRVRRVGSVVYIQNEEGKWRDDEFSHRHTITSFEKHLIFRQEKSLTDYGGDYKNQGALLQMLPHATPEGEIPIQFDYQFVSASNPKAVGIFQELLARCCNHNKQVLSYVINYLAHLLQKPLENPGVCLIFTGAKGCGKDTPFDFLIRWVVGPMFSFNYNKTDTLFKDHDTGRMNKFLVKVEEAKRSVCLEFADELKTFITSKTQSFNPKNKATCSVPSYNRFIFTTNGANPVDFSQGERRFLISNCDPSKKGDSAYWSSVNSILMTPEAGRAVADYLLSVSLEGFNLRDIPVSDYQAGVVANEVRPEELWVEQWVDTDWRSSSDLYLSYRQFCSDRSLPTYCQNAVGFGRLLHTLYRDGKVRWKNSRGGSRYFPLSLPLPDSPEAPSSDSA